MNHDITIDDGAGLFVDIIVIEGYWN